MSPDALQDEELLKLQEISDMSTHILDLKKKKKVLAADRNVEMKNKCDRVKKMRLLEYKKKNQELDEKERDLCRKTNQLVDDFVEICDNTPFHKALIKILGNMKGKLT